MDSVQSKRFTGTLKLPHKRLFFSPVLDDRLGVYTILHELIDLPYDILLTTDEEKGNSSAKDFVTDKQYNWIFEFDRKGTDVVMYHFENKKFDKILMESGFKLGKGSYSDIADLKNLGCVGFNFGVAYYDYHSIDAYCNMDEYQNQIIKFRTFFEENKDIHYEYTYTAPKYPTYYGSKYGSVYAEEEWCGYGNYNPNARSWADDYDYDKEKRVWTPKKKKEAKTHKNKFLPVVKSTKTITETKEETIYKKAELDVIIMRNYQVEGMYVTEFKYKEYGSTMIKGQITNPVSGNVTSFVGGIYSNLHKKYVKTYEEILELIIYYQELQKKQLAVN